MKAIVGGTILTPHRTIKRGVVLIDEERGKIVEVGGEVKVPKDAEVVEVWGKYVIQA